MRLETRIYEYTVKIFEVGEKVCASSNRSYLEKGKVYTVVKFMDSLGYGDYSYISVIDDETGQEHCGIPTEYIQTWFENTDYI